jgi:hypothetical protein
VKTKRILIAILLFALFTQAHAWLFLASPVASTVMWLGRAAATNPVRAKALEWTIAGHGAIGYLLWKNSNDTQPASATPAVATITIVPDTTAKRDNPDPKVFDDATVRNPTPKSSFTQSSLYQPVFANVKADDLVYASMDTPQVYYANSPLNTNISKTTYLTPSSKVNPGTPYTQYLNWTLTSGAKAGQNFIVYSKPVVSQRSHIGVK